MLGRFTLSQLALAIFVPGLVIRYVVDKQFEDEDRASEETYQKNLADMNARRGGVNQKTS